MLTFNRYVHKELAKVAKNWDGRCKTLRTPCNPL